MKRLTNLARAFALLALTGNALAAHGPSVSLNGMAAGPTPFISVLDLTVSPPGAIKSVEFSIEPKPGSVTRPIAASYSSAWLQGRGYLNPTTGHLSLPVFGLYQNYANAVAVTYDFRQGPSQQDTVIIPTAPWADPTGGLYTTPAVVRPRTANTDLSYDFIMLKGFVAAISPIIIDTDAEVRWVGTANLASISGIFWENGIYVSNGSGITREELDGTFRPVADYSGMGVNFTGHHNYDPGKTGFLVECNTTTGIESFVMEVDGAGRVLKTWDVAAIVRAAMIAGGDDPSAFVRAPDDWFHNNSCTYMAHEDTLAVSGREDFVIGLDYETGAIKWILGDPTKAWYQYPSLRKYALTLLGSTHPPIGQHSLSITKDRELMLFDNGRASFAHNPIGEDRTYSAPRKYRINERKMTAEETWTYLAQPSIYSPYCSSVHEDERDNLLMDYTLGSGDVIGLDRRGDEVFHYQYSVASFCSVSWHANPIHLENLVFP